MSTGSVYAFWFLNHRLRLPELRRQLGQIKAQGFSGVFPHPREGLLTPYLSKEWFDSIRFIARECRRLGLEFWLYDEDPYPSGVCGGKVTFDHEEFACRFLQFHEHQIESDGAETVVDLPAGEFLSAFALRVGKGGTMRHVADLTSRCGLVRTQWTPARRVTSGYYPPYQNLGQEHWRTSAVGAHWRAHVRLPRGRYLIVGVFVQRGTNPKWGAYADLMNPRAVEYFIQHTHERYRKELGPKLFANVKGIFTDEAKVSGAFPWTRALPDEYAREFRESLLSLVPHLKYDLDQRSAIVRNRYRRLVSKLFRTAFVRPIYDWCRRRRIRSTGHFSPEEDPIGQQAMIPDLMDLLKDMQLPGIDLISSNMGTPDRCIINIGPKLVCSAARQAGRREVLSESLGVSGEDLTVERAKSMLDWQMALGVSKFVLHGQFYSLDGPRKREAPPSIFETAPYWPFFRKLTAYLDRTCKTLREGQRICSLAILYPTTHINIALPEAEKKLSDWRQRLGELCFHLLSRGFDFDFVSEQDFVSAKHARNGLKVGRCCYKALLIPDVDVVEQATADALRRVKVPLVFLRQRPRALESGKAVAKVGRLCIMSNLESALERMIERPLIVTKRQDLFCHSRWIGRRKIHFVFNPLREEFRGELIVGSGKWPDARDDQTGAFAPLPQGSSGRPMLELPPLGSALLRESGSVPARPRKAQAIDVPGPWTIEPCGDNVLILDRWQAGRSRFRLPHDAEAVPQGEMLRSYFFVKSLPAAARLVWEQATFNAPYELRLNGTKITGKAERVYDSHNLVSDVAHLLVKGKNLLEIRFRGPCERAPMIDPLRLIGTFVIAQKKDAFQLSSFDGTMKLDRPIDWVKLGWPFYSGVMAYETTFDAPSGGKDVRLRIDGLRDLAEVEVNGKVADVIAWKPYECDIGRLVRRGRNRLRLRVANSFVNFIEGEPRPSGITGQVQIICAGS